MNKVVIDHVLHLSSIKCVICICFLFLYLSLIGFFFSRHESELIKEFIRTLWTKLEPNLPRFIDERFVGIDIRQS